MFTYGYLREAIMARLDIDEEEAEAMHLLERFHIYCNEAMQAICGSKPQYKYVDVTVVDKNAPLVWDGAFLRLATEAEIKGEVAATFATEEQARDWYHEHNTYLKDEVMYMDDKFLSFADKEAYIEEKRKPTIPQLLEAEAFGKELKEVIVKRAAKSDEDFSYVGKNGLIFHKEGRFYIPARFLWFRFDSGIADEQEIDMPADILLTIPMYVGSICFQIDNPQRAQMMRNEFEIALSRCVNMDFTTLKKIPKSW